MRGWVAAVALVLAAVGSAGCGAGEDAAPPEQPPGDGAGPTITATDFALDPATVSVEEAGAYAFVLVNEGDVEHALTVDGDDFEAETETVAPGAQAELTVELPAEGEYELYCPIGNHRDLGMEAVLVVGQAGGGETTTEDEDEDEGEDEDGDYRY